MADLRACHVAREHHVVWLQVAVDDWRRGGAVEAVQAAGAVERDLEDAAQRRLRPRLQRVGEGAPLEDLADDSDGVGAGARAEELDDVRVAHAAEDVHLEGDLGAVQRIRSLDDLHLWLTVVIVLVVVACTCLADCRDGWRAPLHSV